MDKVVLVTGASKGLGKAIAQQLADKGATVIVGVRTLADGEKFAGQMHSAGKRVTAVQLDVADDASVAAAAEAIGKQFGKLDVLVNNAGVLLFGEGGTLNASLLKDTYEVNVFGVMRVTEAMLPLLRRGSYPQIINISSEVGSFAAITNPNNEYYGLQMIGYTTSKTALNAITVQTAKLLAAENIAVNAVNPGYLDTDLNRHSGNRPAEDAAKSIVELALNDLRPTGEFLSDNKPTAW